MSYAGRNGSSTENRERARNHLHWLEANKKFRRVCRSNGQRVSPAMRSCGTTLKWVGNPTLVKKKTHTLNKQVGRKKQNRLGGNTHRRKEGAEFQVLKVGSFEDQKN